MNYQENKSRADWTMMVYIGATAVLDNFAVESLRQLKRSAGDGVTVVAQFDAFGHDKIRRLIFDGTGELNASIENDVVDRFVPDNSKKPAEFLQDFVVWAYGRPECEYAATALEDKFSALDQRFYDCSPSLQECLEQHFKEHQSKFVTVAEE